MQFLTGSDATVTSPPFVAADGYTPTDTAALATVTVTSAAGQTLTVSAVSNLADAGLYSVTVQGLTSPDLLTFVWAGQVGTSDQRYEQQVEVVGGVYVTLGEMYAYNDVDSSKYPPSRISELRAEFEDIAERWTGQAWVPRFAKETLYGSLLSRMAPRSLVSVVDSYSTVVDFSGWLLEPSGRVNSWYGSYSLNAGTAPYTVAYRHGADLPPADLVGACKTYIRAKLLEDGNRIGKDTLSFADPSGGTTRYSTPDWNAGRPTGLLDVDRVLCSLGAPLPGVA